MVLLQWPLAHGLIVWSSHLLNKLKGHDSILHSFPYQTGTVAINHLFNNVATKDFDGNGRFYPVELLPTGTLNNENVNFTLPNWGDDRLDNVISDGQVVTLDFVHVREFHLLYAGDWIDGETGARFTFEFADGSTQSVECSVKNWWNLHWLNSGPIQLPYHRISDRIDYNITQIHHWSTPVKSHSALRRIRFPAVSEYNRLHIFAISLGQAHAFESSRDSWDAADALVSGKKDPKPSLGVKNLAMTTRVVEAGEHQGDPVVEVTLANLAASTRDIRFYAGFLNATYAVHVVGDGISTSVPGRIKRLMPGDDARIDVGIDVKSHFSGSSGAIRVHLYDMSGHLVLKSEEWELPIHSTSYEATKESLDKHETPRWWRDSKFGIFIHWGVYSVPGWVPIGYYEEWYHWWIHNPAQPSNILWNYHRDVYGEDVVYDDFIPQFNGAKFDAAQWIDLFANAGAKYFVLVTKHHDGFALFDTGNSTHRSSYHLGPKRDFLDELMSASKERHPELKRGTYYSMPEWFNPAVAGKYGFGNWPGGLARNAYDHSKMEPYTGHLDGKDYLRDIQEAHMKILAERYETDIMFAAKWYNDAQKSGRQVTMNNRCGIAPDFDTPEYARFSSVQTRSWETNEGIDPYSYGYNRQTKDDDYRSAKDIIHSLVDIVSKNGNYLLNLGPTGEGEIIPAMVERLVEVGQWLGHSGNCIYNTTYSFPGAEEGDLRFTTTTDTFCIISLKRPDILLLDDEERHYMLQEEVPLSETGNDKKSPMALLTVDRSVPVLPHDKIYLLGGSGNELRFYWKQGKLEIQVPVEELNLVKHAWAFQIRYA